MTTLIAESVAALEMEKAVLLAEYNELCVDVQDPRKFKGARQRMHVLSKSLSACSEATLVNNLKKVF